MKKLSQMSPLTFALWIGALLNYLQAVTLFGGGLIGRASLTTYAHITLVFGLVCGSIAYFCVKLFKKISSVLMCTTVIIYFVYILWRADRMGIPAYEHYSEIFIYLTIKTVFAFATVKSITIYTNKLLFASPDYTLRQNSPSSVHTENA